MKKRILSLIIAMALAVGAVVSLSSCDVADVLLNALNQSGNASGSGGELASGDEGAPDDTPEDGSQNDNTGSTPAEGDGAGNTDPEGDVDESEDVEYIPGASDEAADADGLTSVQRALLSTVIVRCNFAVYNGFLSSTSTELVNGSGVIYTLDREAGDAIIITNYHVVYYKGALTADKISDDINLYLYGMEAEQYKIKAEFVGGSLTEDIAVLRVSGSDVIRNSCALSVNIGSSASASVTDRVLAVGNPEGDGISATEGIISANDETIQMTAADGRTLISIRVMRVDCGINQGNSGGGLYDADGRLIGIVNAKKTGADIDNIGWALPIDRVKNLVENILDHCDGETVKNPKKALVGITLKAAAMGVTVDEVTGDVKRYEVVRVHEITDTCIIPDEIQVGDRVLYTTVDGVRLDADRVHKVVDHLLTARVGSVLVIGIERGGETREITVTLTDENFVEIK